MCCQYFLVLGTYHPRNQPASLTPAPSTFSRAENNPPIMVVGENKSSRGVGRRGHPVGVALRRRRRCLATHVARELGPQGEHPTCQAKNAFDKQDQSVHFVHETVRPGRVQRGSVFCSAVSCYVASNAQAVMRRKSKEFSSKGVIHGVRLHPLHQVDVRSTVIATDGSVDARIWLPRV